VLVEVDAPHAATRRYAVLVEGDAPHAAAGTGMCVFVVPALIIAKQVTCTVHIQQDRTGQHALAGRRNKWSRSYVVCGLV
jgi:hypothetical protein